MGVSSKLEPQDLGLEESVQFLTSMLKYPLDLASQQEQKLWHINTS